MIGSAEQQRIKVEIPEDAQPGQQLQVEKDGETFLIVCPPNVKPGSTMDLVVKSRVKKSGVETPQNNTKQPVNQNVNSSSEQTKSSSKKLAEEEREKRMKEMQTSMQKRKEILSEIDVKNQKPVNLISAEEARKERLGELQNSVSKRSNNVSKSVGIYEHEQWLHKHVVKEARF
mmetsp:Transcript_12198/g.14793  ORF Transcript_12198/g.14793 Transcript_12198/m.14793 type:complete len:174 (+) Transcript_12198:193-714(+)|eukprot:CAMPEP_0184030204 /NCGR_PEP_ID=MMETSP0955-20130417/1253_1 /TAXON_ID=627963 /ORGANISM="Aplanochytrium sp, Strain PBS07" /LENGTH=173 /DNA_ID=CAMNT_0026315505 /DNA_START=104 /DNA_END=625 /DNA_ORIENTATION=-